jgi:hypothetical protein
MASSQSDVALELANCRSLDVFDLPGLRHELELHAASLVLQSPDEVAGTWAWWEPYLAGVADPAASYALLRQPDGTPSMPLVGNPRGRLSSVSNYYTPLYALRADEESARAGALALATAAVVELWPLTVDAALAWAGAFRELGWHSTTETAHANWFLPCGGLSFDTYLASRPAALRHTYQRKLRAFTRGQHGLRTEIITEPGDVERAMHAYEQVYARSWKPPESHPGFIRAWASSCAQRGWLRLGLAWRDDRPIAAQFWYTAHGKACVFKLAYEQAEARWSAGTVLTGQLMQHALDADRVQEVDYLSGDDGYKRDWMTERRERMRLVASNLRRPAGAWCALKNILRSRLRYGPDQSPPATTQLR